MRRAHFSIQMACRRACCCGATILLAWIVGLGMIGPHPLVAQTKGDTAKPDAVSTTAERTSEERTTAKPTTAKPTIAGPTIAGPTNVIVIMTDEHNFRTLGCYRKTMEKRQAYMWGPAVVETPHIDRLAEQGALFTSFYATTPVCSPSRAALVSGRYPQATPVVGNNIPLADGVVTFAEVLTRNGYRTGFAGKWHLDGSGKPQWAPQRKFGFQDNRYMFNRGHWKNLKLTDDGPQVGTSSNGRPSYDVGNADETSFTTDYLIDRAIEFVEVNKENPFCYMISIPDPHGPDTVRAPYDTMYQDQVYEKPTTFDVDERTVPKWGEPAKRTGFGQSKYYGMIKCIDDNVGRLIAKLEQEGLLDKTLIVFTADHGDLRGEHHRQNKSVPYEGSVKVPFVMRLPSSIAPGTVVDQALSSVDLAPTLMSLLSIKTAVSFDGRDFSPLVVSDPNPEKTSDPDANTTSPANWHDIAFVRGTGDKEGWLMAVTDRYKLIFSSSDEPWLFDLQRDPDEVVNMIHNPAYREIAKTLGGELERYGEKFEDPRVQQPRIAKDIHWAAHQDGPYPKAKK